jgi:hypothetical protein
VNETVSDRLHDDPAISDHKRIHTVLDRELLRFCRPFQQGVLIRYLLGDVLDTSFRQLETQAPGGVSDCITASENCEIAQQYDLGVVVAPQILIEVPLHPQPKVILEDFFGRSFSHAGGPRCTKG